MGPTPDGLARQLANSAESDIVRITASWLSRTPEWTPEPHTIGEALPLTSDELLNADQIKALLLSLGKDLHFSLHITKRGH